VFSSQRTLMRNRLETTSSMTLPLTVLPSTLARARSSGGGELRGSSPPYLYRILGGSVDGSSDRSHWELQLWYKSYLRLTPYKNNIIFSNLTSASTRLLCC
jgi:hypothetical protein